MHRSTSRAWPCCALLLTFVLTALLPPLVAQESAAGEIDERQLRADLQQAIEQRRHELLPEYNRRVREHGRAEADAWLRTEAERLGRRDGERIRRAHERGRYATEGSAATASAAGREKTRERTDVGAEADDDRRGRKSCARMVTRQRMVPSMSGGAMQMIMVTECVPESD